MPEIEILLKRTTNPLIWLSCSRSGTFLPNLDYLNLVSVSFTKKASLLTTCFSSVTYTTLYIIVFLSLASLLFLVETLSSRRPKIIPRTPCRPHPKQGEKG